MTITDDGQIVVSQVKLYIMVGGQAIGPVELALDSRMSFPIEDTDQWARDMIVAVLEQL